MATHFDQYAAKGNELINILAGDLQVSNEMAHRILRCVLHGLRNRLPVDDSLRLIAQLPMIVKGLYVDQWDTSKPPKRIRHLSEFFEEIRQYDKDLAGYDLGNDEETAGVVKAVFRSLRVYLTEGEFRHIEAALPEALKALVDEAIGQRRMPM
ncbi:MAG TPA: DUF2267 domain-containing protein [Puia sp.]|uniref:DUF2267 domain-containing protein n=1 Tax=Puia sp. TaxID=2045100 RepID=UPI002C7261B4|nr:DUF2267 domain-containing protein [Puia sp.]HVU98460.1 DUF2267 domain-containing protein [Puia sp.]